MTTTQLVNVEIPRDRWGRPMLLPPNSKNGKRVPYRRVTTYVKCLDDMNGLMAWKARQVAYGMGQRRDLVLAAAAADPTDKRKLGEIADSAAEHALSSAGATTGTALHALTERVDRGQPLGHVPAEFEADIKAYQTATAAIEYSSIETFRAHDDWQVAGTADRIGTWRGRNMIMDIKSGSIDYPHAMAMQLAMYAHSIPYDIGTDTRQPDTQPVDLNYGLIIHLPAGQGRCDLYEIDIAKGWGACLIARQVWDWRSTKNLTRQVDPHTPTPSAATWESLIANADSRERLREIWSRANQLGELTPQLRAQCTQRATTMEA